MAILARLNPNAGAITPEQAAEWKLTLERLVQQGAAALPAIREFLARNEDVNLRAAPGGEVLGQPTLRLALLEVLHASGDPGAIEISHQTLSGATDPREIAALTRYLQAQAPGQFLETALDATRRSLALAADGKLDGRDVGPLFGLMQQHGGSAVVPDLENALGQWRHYSAIALAGLPEGAGLPALTRLARGSPDTSLSAQTVALQMLAQVATQHPEARAALIEQARQDRIPAPAWMELASVLEGHVFQIGVPSEGSALASPAGMANTRTYHLSYGNQNFSSVRNPAGESAEQSDQRLALINDLLSATSNPDAIKALQKARTALAN